LGRKSRPDAAAAADGSLDSETMTERCRSIHPLKPVGWFEPEAWRLERYQLQETEWRCDKSSGHRGLCEHHTEMGGLVVWVPMPARDQTGARLDQDRVDALS
jgi:hypothetical protein